MDDLVRQIFKEKLQIKGNGCWEWGGYRNPQGYGVLRLMGRPFRAHRLSWELNRGEIPPRLLVCHKCDNPPCVNPDHLFLGTHRVNSADSATKGRQGKKLSEQNVKEIIDLYNYGLSQKDISKLYGVVPSTINYILNGTDWSGIHRDFKTTNLNNFGRPREYEQLNEKIPEMYKEGFTVREIAHLTGMSKSTAHRMIRRLEINGVI